MKKTIIGHRGAPRLAHENTIESFSKALEAGAKGVELDIRMTKDGVLAVFHDPSITGHKISELSFAELNNLATKENFQVPALDEALEFVRGKARVQIEIKEMGHETEVAETALKTLQASEFVVISFNFESLQRIKEKYSFISTGLILGSTMGRLKAVLKFIFFRQYHLKYLSELSINYKLRNWGFLHFIPANFPITIWTADDPKLITDLILDKRVKYIASNVPDLAIKLLKNHEPQ